MKFPYKVKDTKSIQKNFDYLSTFFGRLLGVGATSVSAMTCGSVTITWGGVGAISNFPTVTHGLKDSKGNDLTPKSVTATANGGLAGGKRVLVTAYAITATNFVVDGVTNDGSVPVVGTTCVVSWKAQG